MGEHLILLNKGTGTASPERAFRWENFLPKLQRDKAKKIALTVNWTSFFPHIPEENIYLAWGYDKVAPNENLIPILMQMSQSAFDPVLIAQ